MNAKTIKWRYGIWIVIFLFSMLNFAHTQEIPNGDGDLLWERSIYPRFVNDAKFHPVNGNIIAAVNHEIWEIDPKDGHTIRVFEGGVSGREIKEVYITSDGKYLATNIWGATGIVIWDYNTGNIWKTLKLYGQDLGILPNNQELIFYNPDGDEICVYNYITETKVRSMSIKKSGTNIIDRMTLSNDGKFLAIGFKYILDNNDRIYSMELWDAETLTKIKDYGEDNTIGEFNDIQISSNNKYVAFQGGGHLNFFYLNGEKIGLFLKDDFTTFCFSYDGNYTIIGGLKQNYYQVYVMRNPMDKELYTYSKMIQNFRVNLQNEIFCGSEKIKLYSNKWFAVGIKPNFESKTIISPNPATDYINVEVQNIEPLKEIEIYDIFGECILSTPSLRDTPQEGNLRIDVSALPPGVYFLKIGNEKPNKFIKL